MSQPVLPGPRRTDLAALARHLAGEPAPKEAGARSTGPAAPGRDTAFETLPGYRVMADQRALASLAGVPNPYYRVHEARAGATTRIDGRACLNFASYDYLGLNGHEEVVAAACEALETWGSSVSGSRMTAGERQVHRDLEAELAALYGADDSAVFVSGHATAVSTLAALMGPRDLILVDALVHNCILVGAQLSGATRRSVPHGDVAAMRAILERDRDRFERCLIVTEGLFSMDGDGGDLAALVGLKEAYGCWLMVDDAHGLGVLGHSGQGAGEHAGIDPRRVDIWMGTLSKTLVSCGGYVAGSRALVEFLKFAAPGLVYSVGLPAPSAAAALAALRILRRGAGRVARLQAMSRLLHGALRDAGFDTGTSWGLGIIPVIFGDTATTALSADRLLKRGINAFPILPPGVPEKTARLRFFVSAGHEEDQLLHAVDALSEVSEELRREGGGLAQLRRLFGTAPRASASADGSPPGPDAADSSVQA